MLSVFPGVQAFYNFLQVLGGWPNVSTPIHGRPGIYFRRSFHF